MAGSNAGWEWIGEGSSAWIGRAAAARQVRVSSLCPDGKKADGIQGGTNSKATQGKQNDVFPLLNIL